jgi:hypothetical protein
MQCLSICIERIEQRLAAALVHGPGGKCFAELFRQSRALRGRHHLVSSTRIATKGLYTCMQRLVTRRVAIKTRLTWRCCGGATLGKAFTKAALLEEAAGTITQRFARSILLGSAAERCCQRQLGNKSRLTVDKAQKQQRLP